LRIVEGYVFYPSTDFQPCNVALGAVAGAAPPKFRPGWRPWPAGVGAGRSGGPPSSIWEVDRVWEVAGEGAHRRPVAVAAASRAALRQRFGWGPERHE
jgi:hypothetical protein